MAGCSGLPLAERLVGLPDPRQRRGRRHPFVAVLLISACAVVAGALSYTAIAQWARNAPQETLARLGARLLASLNVRIAPSRSTIRRVVIAVCPGGLADLTGSDPSGAEAVAVDGKSARGSRCGQVPAAHLLAAMTGDGRTVTQLRVPGKTNEITCFTALLEPFDLTGIVVTADALHTQRDHATFLVEAKRAHYVFTVKKNQPLLHQRLRDLPWERATAKFYDRTVGHGRRETRVVQVLTVDDLAFPHTAQVARITRHRTSLKTGKRTRETVYAITDLTSRQASPEKIAKLVRSQWVIENRLHFVRDVTFDEDRSQIRTGHGPENMATLRNLAINTLRDHGHASIAAGLREMSYHPFTPPPRPPQHRPVTSNNTKITRLWNSPAYKRRAPSRRQIPVPPAHAQGGVCTGVPAGVFGRAVVWWGCLYVFCALVVCAFLALDMGFNYEVEGGGPFPSLHVPVLVMCPTVIRIASRHGVPTRTPLRTRWQFSP
ncbi:ISAs1 family transposase [Streptomyces sp. ET3-23]|uniref:ISAs1 family transposase n=1 Tax=Streptomyces sp. ET3-23 TaxID=2885643 RepID=UPI001D0FE26B|nr:ISAs1 family transposase [Streptomyces sp. ET3-23]MCC2275214.1 ISAs1 family transposase [Streptomyces sp. ET3-23]